ncbi:MAG TPA: hypothetical protein VKU19_41775 [Bryobacteraceae bacterium]|nr:hypothetical protein [Bryobacteraceae bacterium]
MLLVTFHQTIPNIYGYDETHPGSDPIEDLLEIKSKHLSELRGMLLANGFLYVVNGGKSMSNILCCAPDPNQPYHFTEQSEFASKTLGIMDHPFDCTFRIVQTSGLPSQTEMQIWYVSNQDSNIVALRAASPPYETSQASSDGEYLTDLLVALKKAGSSLARPKFLPSTFVGTSLVAAEIPPQTPVAPSWGGLTPILDSSQSKVQNSVRGVVVNDGVLYVADEGGNAVRMYDAGTGVPWGSTTVSGPVHLLINQGILYVTSSDSVLSGPCVTPPANPPSPPAKNQFESGPVPPPYPAPPAGYTDSVTLTLQDLGLNLPKDSGPSGLAFDSSGNLYVALRKAQQIFKFVPNTSPGGPPFVPFSSNPIFDKLKDSPEFLLWIPTQS